MRKILLVVAAFAVLVAGGCATPSTVKTVAPVDDFKSAYRQTKEVLLVGCVSSGGGFGTARRAKEQVSVVETTDTGIRFTVSGCLGNVGDRFRITY